MKDAVAAHLALRRTAGFEMANAEYLLDSFARFATERNETHVARKPRSIGPLQGHPRRDATSGLKRSVGSPVTSASKTIGTSCHRRTTSDAVRRAGCRTSTHPTKLADSWRPPDDSVLVAR
jgi:hypothetical protein